MTGFSAQNWQVIGHQWAVEQLTRAMNSGRNRHAYLFSGPPSVGKTTLARSMAMALNCLSTSNKPCGECRACTLIAKDSHPDVAYVEADRVGGTLKIDQIRDLQHLLSLRPYEAQYRVAIIKRYQEAHVAASNALLKTLEEPAKSVVIILLTDNLHALLPTIISRCQHVPLHPLPIQQVEDALKTIWRAHPTDANLLAHLSGGRIGWAIETLHAEDTMKERDDYVDLLEQLLSQPRRVRFKALDDFTRKKDQLEHILQIWQTYWRDAFLLAHGNPQWITNVDHQAQLAEIAQRCTPDSIQQALQATRRTLDYLQRNVNTKLAIETLMLDYPFITSAAN